MKLIVTTLVGVLLSISAAAQERSITEAEFTEINSKVQAELARGDHGPWRMTVETDTSTEGRPEITYQLRSVTRTVPGQGSHRVENRSIGGKPTKYESIALIDRSFSRTDDGKWVAVAVKSRLADEPTRNPAATSQAIERRVQFVFNGVETHGSRKVNVYTKTEFQKKLNTASGSTSESSSVTKLRISPDGKYYRFEANTDTLAGRGTAGKIRINIEMEADPTITIAAPDTPK